VRSATGDEVDWGDRQEQSLKIGEKNSLIVLAYS
jgi:hypothetical protein